MKLKTQTAQWDTDHKQKVIEPKDLKDKIRTIKASGQTIVTLNGSFDLLHAGHLQITYEAKQQGDILIVALNSDSSIQQYKSPDRPIIPLQYRVQMMAALQFVDFVTWFDETDPREILSVIQPNVHVNGADYGENCVEAEVVKAHGGKIYLVKLIPGLSTSQIIQKIQ